MYSEIVEQALELIVDRRPGGSINPQRYRQAALAGLRADHRDTINKLDLTRYTAETLADKLEGKHSTPVRTQRAHCHTCEGSTWIDAGKDDKGYSYVKRCPDCASHLNAATSERWKEAQLPPAADDHAKEAARPWFKAMREALGRPANS